MSFLWHQKRRYSHQLEYQKDTLDLLMPQSLPVVCHEYRVNPKSVIGRKKSIFLQTDLKDIHYPRFSSKQSVIHRKIKHKLEKKRKQQLQGHSKIFVSHWTTKSKQVFAKHVLCG